MLATTDCTNHYADQTIYESEWTENLPNGISWFNILTAQPIPEETDGVDTSHTPERNNSGSSCSSSSVESCYVVLEIQRPRSVDEISTSSKIDDDEEIEEEIEELHFAQTKTDDHHVDYDQFAVSMITEAPMEEYVVEYQQEQIIDVQQYAKVTQPIIHEPPNDILFRKAKTLTRFTKRIKAMSSYTSTTEQHFSTSSDDEPLNITKLKPIRKINEYHPTVISTVTAEQPSIHHHSNSSPYSTTSLDSIENKSPSSPKMTTTFSNLSSQRSANPIQTQRTAPTMGTTTLTRTFAFDRACMEKYGRGQEQKNEPVCPTIIKEEIQLPPQPNIQTELLSSTNDKLHCRSFTNTIPTSIHIDSAASTIDDSKSQPQSPILPPTTGSNSFSKASSIICLMKKYARTVTSDYRLPHNNHEKSLAEPTLLQVKYLDGRHTLKDDHARESFRKTQTLSGSIANRLNRLGLQKMSSTQDLSSTSSPLNISYRKRMLNRFRTVIENHSSETQPSTPWQHKTISELFNERKYKVNRH